MLTLRQARVTAMRSIEATLHAPSAKCCTASCRTCGIPTQSASQVTHKAVESTAKATLIS